MAVPKLPPVPMDHKEKSELRHLAFKATRLYPGPVGELVSRELLAWEEFGYRLGSYAQVRALMRAVEQTPSPPMQEPRAS